MIAYFDCFSGISGDMTLGAFIDLGVPAVWIKETIQTLPLYGFDLSVQSIARSGIQASQVLVEVQHGGHARDYAEIASLIENSPLSEAVKARSLDIFGRIADAESRIHRCPLEKVHFHEVGAVDAIVDIVGAALCIDYLKIDRVSASRIPLGTGFVTCMHGPLPVPAPATLEILKGLPVYGSGIEDELVTPTGAAILASLADSFGSIPDMAVESVGYGAGQRELAAVPNLLRVMIGTPPETPSVRHDAYLADTVVVVEACIDDMNPEIFGFVMERLFEDGALDVCWTPVFMKKNRPGTMIQVLCRKERMEAVIERVLTETTSIGLRYYEARRRMLAREDVRIDTPFGRIQVKRVSEINGKVRIVPEYDVCRRIALEKNLPIRIVYEVILEQAAKQRSSACSLTNYPPTDRDVP